MTWIRAYGGAVSSVPDGQTVTPINDVTIWQRCAGIANPTYTTLAEVLADTGILSTLMASNNAVDYLVRCKNWCGTALVPAMTSNTTPSGKCSAQNVYNDNEPYKAFDRDGSNAGWISDTLVSSGQSTERWIEYDFDLPQYIKSFKLFPRSGNSLSSVELFDADTSTTVELFSGSYAAGVEHEFILTNPVSISKCRLYITAVAIGNGRIPQISSIQFYTPNTICSNANAMTYIGQNNYASNTLLADSDWCNAICNSAYFESVLNVKVPIMTSNTTPSGECFGDTPYDGALFNAFDDNDATACQFKAASETHKIIGYKFESAVSIYKCVIKANSQNVVLVPSKILLQGSNDNNTFSGIGTEQNVGAIKSNETQSFIFENPSPYQWIRIDSTLRLYNGSYYSTFGEIQFYGREDV